MGRVLCEGSSGAEKQCEKMTAESLHQLNSFAISALESAPSREIDLCVHLLLQKCEQRSIELVSLPVLELSPRTIRVEHAKRSAEIPQRPSGIQFTQNVECVAKPCQHNIGRSVLVTPHFAEVSLNPLRRKIGPGMKGRLDRLAVANDFSLIVLERPRGHLL